MKEYKCSVSAILYNNDNQILFVSPNGYDRWQTVIGGLEKENVEEGILREIKEELGLSDVLIIDVLDVHTFRYRDVENMLSIWFLVKYKRGKIIPSDDIAGYTYKWFGENEISSLDITCPQQPEIIRKAFYLIPLYEKNPDCTFLKCNCGMDKVTKNKK